MTKLKSDAHKAVHSTRVMEVLSKETVSGLRVLAYRLSKEA